VAASARPDSLGALVLCGRGEFLLINFGNRCCKNKPTQAVHIFLMFPQPAH